MSRFQRKLYQTILAFLVTLSSLFFLGSASFAGEGNYGQAKLVISNLPGEHLSSIHWKESILPVEVFRHAEQREAQVSVHGTVDRADLNLVFRRGSLPLAPNPQGGGASFTQKIRLTGRVTLVSFYIVDELGRYQEEKLAIVFPDWAKFELEGRSQNDQAGKKQFFYSGGLGFSYEGYNEPTNIQLSELAMVGKINLVYALSPGQWELGGNAFVNLFPVFHSPSDRVSARWYGLNGRLGYHLPISSVKYTNFWLMTGWYMWGMWVNAPAQSAYGVSYLTGPQLFVTARIAPPGGRAGWLYMKYASISDAVALFSASNRELALGGGIQLNRAGVAHPVSLTLDLADAGYSSPSTNQSFTLFSTSLGVSISL